MSGHDSFDSHERQALCFFLRKDRVDFFIDAEARVAMIRPQGAPVAELADAADSKSVIFGCGSSTLPGGTKGFQSFSQKVIKLLGSN